jgi:hypothetical protein
MSAEARLADKIAAHDVHIGPCLHDDCCADRLSYEDRAVIVRALRDGAHYEELRQMWNGTLGRLHAPARP